MKNETLKNVKRINIRDAARIDVVEKVEPITEEKYESPCSGCSPESDCYWCEYGGGGTQL